MQLVATEPMKSGRKGVNARVEPPQRAGPQRAIGRGALTKVDDLADQGERLTKFLGQRHLPSVARSEPAPVRPDAIGERTSSARGSGGVAFGYRLAQLSPKSAVERDLPGSITDCP